MSIESWQLRVLDMFVIALLARMNDHVDKIIHEMRVRGMIPIPDYNRLLVMVSREARCCEVLRLVRMGLIPGTYDLFRSILLMVGARGAHELLVGREADAPSTSMSSLDIHIPSYKSFGMKSGMEVGDGPTFDSGCNLHLSLGNTASRRSFTWTIEVAVLCASLTYLTVHYLAIYPPVDTRFFAVLIIWSTLMVMFRRIMLLLLYLLGILVLIKLKIKMAVKYIFKECRWRKLEPGC